MKQTTHAERTRYTNAQTTAAKRGTSATTRNSLDALTPLDVIDAENAISVMSSVLGEDATLGQAAALLRKRIGSGRAASKSVNITINF